MLAIRLPPEALLEDLAQRRGTDSKAEHTKNCAPGNSFILVNFGIVRPFSEFLIHSAATFAIGLLGCVVQLA